MSAEIFFGDNPNQFWSVTSSAFNELLTRARRHCASAVAIEALRMAAEVKFLIMKIHDAPLRKELCDAVAAAGRELLAELSPEEPNFTREAEGIKRVIALAEQCAADAG